MSLRKAAFGFAPTSITGCVLWLDASDTTSVIQSGGTITQWIDKSTSALTATANNNPTLVANVQNGFPGISLNGSTQYFNLGNNLSMGTNQLYIFVVSKFNSTADGAIIGKSLYGGGTGRYSLLRVGGTLNPLIQGSGGGNDTGVNSDTSTSTRLLNMVWDRSNINLYQNGSSIFSLSFSDSANVTNGFSLLIGAYQNSSGGTPPVAGLYMNGYIHEILMYMTPTGSPLGNTARQQIESYLAQKWGLATILSAGHPGLTTTVYRPDYIKNSLIVRNVVKPIPYYTQFSPRQIPGLVVWLDGADPAGNGVIPANGSTISTWADKSGNGNNGTAVNTPTYALSSKGVATSSGAYFTLPNGAFPFNDSSYTYFFVFTTTTTGSVNSLFGGGVPGTTRSTVAVRLGTNGANNVIQTYWWQNGIGDLLVTNTYSANAISIAETWYATGSTRTITLNFSGSSTDSPAAPGARLQANTNNYLGLAYPGDGALTGFHYEFLVYNTSLSTTNRQQVESYLAQKWGLTASLPVGHSHLTRRAGAITTVANTKFSMTGIRPTITATGGTVTISGGYKIHTFTSVGTTNFVLTSPSSITAIVLVVAGGGAGGYDDGGGGGAGGVIYNAAFTITSGTYGVVVGNGGTSNGANGQNSVLSSLTAIGGGGGANGSGNGGNGGSGGGIGWGVGNGSTPGSGTAGQGFAGGGGTTAPNYAVGGGGGAGGVGGTGSGITPGNGGIGVSHTIAGTTYNVGGGGGGGLAVQNSNGTNSTASFGGGNGAGRGSSAAVAGTPNTGGGGGGSNNMQATNGAFGGSGIVIIAYSL